MTEKEKELEVINMRREMEAEHYRRMDAMHEQYDVVLHDMRHVMRTIAALAEEGDCRAISHLIDKMGMTLGNIEQTMICSNKMLNALLVERKGYADDSGIVLKTEIKEPLYFDNIDEMDLIVLIGNLLDNAIEAEKSSKKREGILCSIWMAREGSYVIIQIENSYEESRINRKSRIKADEQIGNKHGIGLGSVREIVRKYGGIMENSKSGGRYLVKIILPVQSGWEGEDFLKLWL